MSECLKNFQFFFFINFSENCYLKKKCGCDIAENFDYLNIETLLRFLPQSGKFHINSAYLKWHRQYWPWCKFFSLFEFAYFPRVGIVHYVVVWVKWWTFERYSYYKIVYENHFLKLITFNLEFPKKKKEIIPFIWPLRVISAKIIKSEIPMNRDDAYSKMR